ncbi:MAG: hypothetical protein ACREQ4_12570, partial [Candidatus Binataceae bacterium]
MIELRAPEGFHSNNLGSFPLSDGTVLRRGANGYYSFPDSVDVGSWLMQGWKLRSDIDAERKRELEAQKQRDQREA